MSTAFKMLVSFTIIFNALMSSLYVSQEAYGYAVGHGWMAILGIAFTLFIILENRP